MSFNGSRESNVGFVYRALFPGICTVRIVSHKHPRVIILNMIHTPHIYGVINVLLNQLEKKLPSQLRESAPERRHWLTRGLNQPAMHAWNEHNWVSTLNILSNDKFMHCTVGTTYISAAGINKSSQLSTLQHATAEQPIWPALLGFYHNKNHATPSVPSPQSINLSWAGRRAGPMHYSLKPLWSEQRMILITWR